MDLDIVFTFEGITYMVGSEAYDLGKIILPDGRMLEAEKWLERNPPIPEGLHEVNHLFKNRRPEEIAGLLNAAVAEKLSLLHEPS